RRHLPRAGPALRARRRRRLGGALRAAAAGGELVNRTLHAVRLGVLRGWTDFVQSVTSPQDQGFYLVVALGVLTYLFINRDAQVAGTTLSLPAVALPSILGGLVTFGAVVGPAYSLAMEREDGTLLRARAIPRGVLGYVVGQVVFQALGLVPMLLVILVPSFLLFDGVMLRGLDGWLTLVWVLALGLLATLPIGMVIGSLVKGTQKVGTWGMLPVLLLAATSGIFTPIQHLWGWLQVVAQAFPMYWI